MSDYEKMTLEELQALKAKREADKIKSELKAEDEAISQKEKEIYESSIREKAVKDYLNKNPPVSKLTEKVETTKDSGASNIKEYLNKFVKSTGKDKLMEYACDCDGDDNVSAGHDIDDLRDTCVFKLGVWHSLYCKANLLQYAVPGVDINAGEGLKVRIRTIGKFADAAIQERSACSCLDTSAVAFDQFYICLKQFGMKTEICEFSIFDVGEVQRTEILKAMGFKWGEWIDAQLYNLLSGEDDSDLDCGGQSLCTDYDQILSVDITKDKSMVSPCCSIPAAEELYRAIIDIEAEMREDGREPKVVILSPSVAALFKYEKGTDLPDYIRGNIVVEGNIVRKIGNLNVVETCVANSMRDLEAGAEVVAVIIDPSRAFGFAYGKKPSVESDRNIDCNSTTYAMWAYIGAGILDCSYIARILNA